MERPTIKTPAPSPTVAQRVALAVATGIEPADLRALPKSTCPLNLGYSTNDLAKIAEAMTRKRLAEAEATHPFYEVRDVTGDFGDGSPETVTVQQAGSRSHEEYVIAPENGLCTCADCVHTVSKWRGWLNGLGLAPLALGFCCKHGFIVEHKHAAELLTREAMNAPLPDPEPERTPISTRLLRAAGFADQAAFERARHNDFD